MYIRSVMYGWNIAEVAYSVQPEPQKRHGEAHRAFHAAARPAMHRAHEVEPFVSCPPTLCSALFAHKQECIDIGRRTNTLVLIKKDGVAITRNPRARAGPVYAAAAREVQSWIDRETTVQAKELQAWLTDFTAIDENFGLEVLNTVSANANPLDILATYRADLVASYTLSTEHKQLITVPGTLGLYAPPRLPFVLHKSDQDAGAMPQKTSPSAHLNAAPADVNHTVLGPTAMEAIVLATHLTAKDFKWREMDMITDRCVISVTRPLSPLRIARLFSSLTTRVSIQYVVTALGFTGPLLCAATISTDAPQEQPPQAPRLGHRRQHTAMAHGL